MAMQSSSRLLLRGKIPLSIKISAIPLAVINGLIPIVVITYFVDNFHSTFMTLRMFGFVGSIFFVVFSLLCIIITIITVLPTLFLLLMARLNSHNIAHLTALFNLSSGLLVSSLLWYKSDFKLCFDKFFDLEVFDINFFKYVPLTVIIFPLIWYIYFLLTKCLINNHQHK